ncbi:nucleotide sugar dehydrogenase [Candidatus Micrarchaeota archaeon]|nr:nucleotide sugar dehydrogenase [Candidatus Micrarchaeota archaeon]
MNISVMGTGYVGIVTGTCLAETGNNVKCIDLDPKKVEMINSGKSPIYEPDLEELLKKNLGSRLEATLDADPAIRESEITFICVGTPSSEDGSTDLKYIESAAGKIGEVLAQKEGKHIVVVKSTVPPGTSEKVAEILKSKGAKVFGVAMNPEFLREGKAVEDFMAPDRVVLGAEEKWVHEKLEELYSFTDAPKLETNLRTAEMIKYASNSLLAAKISFANEIGNICKELGIDVYDVMQGVGMDARLSPSFLNAGIGFGGSCFPKDVNSLIHTAKVRGVEPKLLEAVMKVNEDQPLKLVELAKNKLGSLSGKKIAVLGLAFKPDTDDMREAPSLRIVPALVKEGAIVKAYDPEAEENAKPLLGDGPEYPSSAKEAAADAEIVFILTEWKEFEDESLYSGKQVFDGRKLLKRKSGEKYEGVCW